MKLVLIALFALMPGLAFRILVPMPGYTTARHFFGDSSIRSPASITWPQ